MKDERVYFIVMAFEIPTAMGWEPGPDQPVAFLPVFATEAAAKAYAGDRFTISAARISESKP